MTNIPKTLLESDKLDNILNSSTQKDIDIFCKNIVTHLKKSNDNCFLILKLLFMFNNICTVPFSNINSYMSQFFYKNKYKINENIGYLVYSNPIHVCALLAFEKQQKCEQIISILLSELNIIPCGYPILFNDKKDLIFYSSLFGADYDDLILLKYLIDLNKETPIQFFNQLKSYEKDTTPFTDVFTDFISIKYNDNMNKLLNSNAIYEFAEKDKDTNSILSSIIDSASLLELQNETNKSGNYDDKSLKLSLKLTMKILANNESIPLHSCIQFLNHSSDISYDFNIKRICKNIFIKQLNIYNPLHDFNSIDINLFNKYIEKPKLCYDKIVKNVYISTCQNPRNFSVIPGLDISIQQFMELSLNPVQLALQYKSMKSNFIA